MTSRSISTRGKHYDAREACDDSQLAATIPGFAAAESKDPPVRSEQPRFVIASQCAHWVAIRFPPCLPLEGKTAIPRDSGRSCVCFGKVLLPTKLPEPVYE